MENSDFSAHPSGMPISSPAVRFISKPGYLLMSIAGIVFILETIFMFLLMFLPPIATYKEALLDATVLTLTIFPVLYFLVFKPIRIHINLRLQAEDKKDSLIIELREALDEVKTLKGLIPICASCKNIRDDKGFWQQVEVYLTAHSEAEFSHGICPECAKKLYPDLEA